MREGITLTNTYNVIRASARMCDHNSEDLLFTYTKPGKVQSTLHILTYLTFFTSSQSFHSRYYLLDFRGKEAEA